MTESEIRRVIAQVLAEENEHLEKKLEKFEEKIDSAVMRVVAHILLSFGIDDEERLEIRSDMAHLRRSRKAYEAVQSAGLKSAMIAFITGILGALWLGIQQKIGK